MRASDTSSEPPGGQAAGPGGPGLISRVGLSLGLIALGAAAGFLLAGQLYGQQCARLDRRLGVLEAEPARPAAIEERLARLEAASPGPEALTSWQERLARLESAQRELLAQQPRRSPGPATTDRLAADMRRSHVEGCRRDYARAIEDLRQTIGADEAEWKKAEPVLERHFEPMEKALAAFEASAGWQPPDIREVVGARVPGTLEALRAALGEAAWKKLEAWRRPNEKDSGIWRQARYAYFLRPEEYELAESAAAAQLRWNLSAAHLQKLFAALGLPRTEQGELEALLHDHFLRYSKAVGALGVGARAPPNADERAAAEVRLTEEKLRTLLSGEKFKAYQQWKAGPTNTAAKYFTAPAKESPPGPGREQL